MLITVIIPIFNTAKYLQRCIESIVKQNLDNVEIIFIDDCSTDNSIEVLNNCLDRCSETNITILHNERNLGSGETRNIGIRKACGEYVIFIDSDDFVPDNYFSVLRENVERTQSDILIFDFTEIRKDRLEYKECAPSPTKEQMIADLIESKMHSSLCNKLFRRALFVDNNITIPIGMSMFEDKSVCFRLFEEAEKIHYINSCLYYYDRSREGSLTSRNQKKNLKSALILMDVLNESFKDKNPSSIIRDALNNNKILITGLFGLYGDWLNRTSVINRIGKIKFTYFLRSSSTPIHFKLAAFFYYNKFKMALSGIRLLYFKYKK